MRLEGASQTSESHLTQQLFPLNSMWWHMLCSSIVCPPRCPRGLAVNEAGEYLSSLVL